jgi:hypothetical protein
MWNSTFTEHGIVQLVKDYRFCRGRNATELYIDAGHGVTLSVQRMNDAFIAPFKSQGLFTVSSLRMRVDTLEEEILIVDDKPGDENTLISMRAISIHLIKMKRISD